MVTLADLSDNNAEPIDFHALRGAGVWGVWLKVSEGQSFADPTFAGRARRARAAGLHVGGYHFARPRQGDAFAQASRFCALLGPVERRDLHPVLDLEANDAHLEPVELWRWARDVGHYVHSLRGVRVLWYSYPSFLAEQRWREPLGTGAGLWLADYGPDDGRDHGLHGQPAPWRRPVCHQYTSRGRLPGVAGAVDLSHARSRRALLAHGLRGLA